MAIKNQVNFKYKLIKNLLLRILIPSLIILFSAWYFFGESLTNSENKKMTNDVKSCSGTTTDTCKAD